MKAANIKVARVYAQVLFGDALKNKQIEVVFTDVQQLQSLIQDNELFASFLNQRFMTPADKISVLDKVKDKLKLSDSLYKFMCLVCLKRRESMLSDIFEQFIYLYYQHKAIVAVGLRTAYSFSEAQSKALKSAFKKQTKAKEVLLQEVLDEELIGGFVLEYQNHILDMSLRHKLTLIEKQLQV